ncbi:MAG: glycosyltransferase family 2 protein [Bacteroidota bacterium]|nr:glycosyltransferase [Candidatus Kapabacteria bacterium]MDW8220994.1 glycosyltransferase family 2 protein [Bacteroidota bacterium]
MTTLVASIIVAVGCIGWLIAMLIILRNACSLPLLQSLTSLPCSTPLVSVIIPACNEAETLEYALTSLLASDYTAIEVLLVNDRSTDNTGAIMEDIASRDKRVRVIHITSLPEGWLGKVHALHVASQQALGKYILFTDADVHFHKHTLSYVLAYVEQHHIDHVTIFPEIRTPPVLSFFTRYTLQVVITCFAALFLLRLRLHSVVEPDEKAFVGIGAFNLVRASVFRQTPGMEWLKMEVIDDVGLGMMMKRYHARCAVLNGAGMLHLVWYPSVKAMARGFEKNFFAGFGQYRWSLVILRIAALVAIIILPIAVALALWLVEGLLLPCIAVFSIYCMLPYAMAHVLRAYVLTTPAAFAALPYGFIVILGLIVLSAYTISRHQGIWWRGTFYPLDALRQEQRVRL